jgi:hypothetical protein
MVLLAIFIIIIGGLAAIVAHFWHDLSRHTEDFGRKWFLQWSARGAATPILIWTLMNIGTMPLMPPLTASVIAARNGGHWIAAMIMQICLGSLVIASCWSSLTCGWFIHGILRRAHTRDDLFITAMIWSPLALLLFWWLTHYIGWSLGGFAALIWLCPMTQYFLMEAQIYKPSPSYSNAIAKMKFGKYGEAEMAIISQLEKSESDFDGWMMLAELYAQQFKDLTQAEQTILDICAEPNTTVSQVSIALHRLADWQLDLRGDPEAARRVLEEICKRMPGTHLATMAQLRINQLPATDKELKEMNAPRVFRLPAAETPTAAEAEPNIPAPDRDEAATIANELVEQLNANPKDIAVREKLARIFESLGKIDLALEQLELLVGMPGTTQEKGVEWLSLMATWETKHHGEGEELQKILRRMIQDYPQTGQAFAAQKRLNLMRR